MNILSEIRSRDDLLTLNRQQQDALCEELREFLIKSVSDSGGHLASNLGIVEATLAIHKVFDTSLDRLVFDVGHQCYVHKILTGRMEMFDTLRQFEGLSGFPKPQESIHDAFIAGHASNAVSVALGMARARTRNGEKHHVLALLGDGALTGGLAYEGLNDAGASGERIIIILNDNGMSITRNVGGISKHLALLRLKPGYFGLKKAYRRFTDCIPGGWLLYRLTHKIKLFLKRGLIGTTIFEEMGLNYLGPVDGHDVEKVTYLLQVAKEMDAPALVHIITQKGKGYKPAEIAPQNYHGVSQFDPEVGVCSSARQATYSDVFGHTMTALAAKDPRICTITAAMEHGTGLGEFAQAYPDRFFDVGIAEGHAVSMAAGMAAAGMIPVVALYSTFLQRAFDMLLHDVALMQNHVIFAVDRAGLVGEDGSTHHGVFDVGYLRQIPGMTVLSPATEEELTQALQDAVYRYDGPVAVRYPRGKCLKKEELTATDVENPEVLLVSYGTMMEQTAKAAALLQENGISAKVMQLHCLKPLDLSSLQEMTCQIFVIEDTVISGCVGQEIASRLPVQVELVNLGDHFVPHGSMQKLYKSVGLDAESICRRVQEVLSHEK